MPAAPARPMFVCAPQSPYNAPGVNVATVQCKEVSALKLGKYLGTPSDIAVIMQEISIKF